MTDARDQPHPAEVDGNCVWPLIVRMAETNSSRIALRTSSAEWTYAELLERTRAISREILSCLGHDQPTPTAKPAVAVQVERGPGTVVALLALLQIGAVYVPVPLAFPPERRRFMRDDAGVAAILRTDRADSTCTLMVSRNHPSGGARRFDPRAAYVMYTSGSSGVPKGVIVGEASLRATITAAAAAFGLSSDDVMLASTSSGFDISLLEFLCPLVVGAVCAIPPDETANDPSLLGPWASAAGVSVVQTTPSVWSELEPYVALPLRLAISGGEMLPEALKDRLLLRAKTVVNCYGPTETTIWSSLWPATDGPVSCGFALPGNEFFVLDDTGKPVATGEVGELTIAGSSLALGYLNRPAETEHAFTWSSTLGRRIYRTGDLATLSEVGELHVLGRRDSQVKVRGHRIELAEIEARLLDLDSVASASVVAVVEDSSTTLAAFVVAADSAPLDPNDLKGQLRAFLPEACVPPLVAVLPRMPTLDSGKVDTVALRHLAEEMRTSAPATTAAPPRSLAEAAVAAAVEAVVKHDVDLDRHVFETGADSLRSVSVVARLRRWLQRPVTLRALLTQETLRGFAEEVGDVRLLRATYVAEGPSVIWAPPAYAAAKRIIAASDLAADLKVKLFVADPAHVPDSTWHEVPGPRVVVLADQNCAAEVRRQLSPADRVFDYAELLQHGVEPESSAAILWLIEQSGNIAVTSSSTDGGERLELTPRLKQRLERYGTHQTAPRNAVGGTFMLEEMPDPSKWRCALEAVVARHDAFRTGFRFTDGVSSVFQEAIALPESATVFVDLQAMGPSEADRSLEDFSESFLTEPFDLERPPLVRLGTVALAQRRGAVVIGLDHSIADATSLAIVLGELAVYVDGGDGRNLPSVARRTYGDWFRAQAGIRQRRPELETFWSRYLGDAGTGLTLPTDRPRPATTQRGNLVREVLPANLYGALRAGAARERASLFMTCFAAVARAVGRAADTDDVTILVPADRRPEGFADVIGDFSTALPVRVVLPDRPEDTVTVVRDSVSAALLHRDLDFSDIARAVGEGGAMNATVPRVFFSLENELSIPLASGRAPARPPSAAVQPFDVSIWIVDRRATQTLDISYSAELFLESRARGWLSSIADELAWWAVG